MSENARDPLHDVALMTALIEAAPDAHVLVDDAGRIVLVNTQFQRLFGYDAAEVVGQPVEMLMPARYRAAHGRHRTTFVDDPHVRPMGVGQDLQGMRKDGAEFPVEISLSPIVIGARRFVSAAIRDATERRRREAKFRDLLEAAPDAMVITDQAGRIVLVNRQAEAIFGYGRDELLGQLVEILIPPRYHDTHPRQRGSYHRSPRARPMGQGLALAARRKDGSEFPVEISLSPLQTEDGLLVTSAIRDVSEKKRAERIEREQFVTKKLVRRLLREAGGAGVGAAAGRKLGRGLGAEADAKSSEDMLHAFAAMGLGELRVESAEGDRLLLSGANLLEVAPGARETTCNLALGFIEGALRRMTSREALGAETSCESQGAKRCTFVIQLRERVG